MPAAQILPDKTRGTPAFSLPEMRIPSGTSHVWRTWPQKGDEIMMVDDEKTIQQNYLEGLKRYKAMGVRIKIDGAELPEDQWEKIFRVSEKMPDGADGFYMADYIAEPEGSISEIRLDRVYVRNLNEDAPGRPGRRRRK